jgi:endo-1,4-beta-xylanase
MKRWRTTKITWRLAASTVAIALFCYALADHLMLLGLSLWVARYDHGTIELEAYDENGNPLDGVQFLRQWRPAMIVRDATGSPVFGIQYGIRKPQIAVPVGQSVSVELLWNVPGFGKVLIDANNDGRGYRVRAHERLRIELLPELARSRASEVTTWVDSHHQGNFASSEAGQELDSASGLIQEASHAADARRRARLSLEALRLALRAGEEEVLAEAQEVIRTQRRGVLRVKVEDAAGHPVSKVEVDVHQRRFEFLFGVYSDSYDARTVARLKGLGLNYAILLMTWERTEPMPGVFSLHDFDRFFELPELTDNGFTVCAHALVWLANGEVPPYVRELRGRTDELVAAAREHVGRIVSRYQGNVQVWEALNEGHPQWSRWGLDDAGLVRLAKASAEEIRKRAPGTPIMVDVALPLGEDVALKYYPLIGLVSMGRIGAASTDPYKHLERLSQAGVPYDILALQIFNGAWVNVAWGVQVPAIDLFRYARVLDRYSRLGKPIQIAEIAVGSADYGTASESWWHAKADQATQADYLEGVFTIAYGNPHVQGINWWGLDDDYRFVEGGGLFDASRHPKLAARRLAELLERWRGSGQMTTDNDGWTSFQVAAGDYHVTAQMGADPVSADVHISEEQTTAWVARAPGNIAPEPASR